MKRTIATLGAVGLAALVVSAPASAAGEITLCHAVKNGFVSITIPPQGLNGHEKHDKHEDDIIPPNEHLKDGLNWGDAGRAIHENGCAAVSPPAVVVDPPAKDDLPLVVDKPDEVKQPVVEQPVVQDPVVEQPVVQDPVVEQPVVEEQVVETPVLTPAVEEPAAAPPAAAPPVVPAKPEADQQQAQKAAGVATTGSTTSRGTNQGYNAQTAAGGPESSPAWLGGLGALVAAGAAVAVRRRSGSSMAG
ncbi:hypothetical protein [Pseudarthrobacter sp. NS4]|uniref:hypothetical protein n=1 Tax=Pseudarthrobacter sp. NS4 TaxID=2973976 RepID=UPI0021624564|nr:hypothetical protein [Pseudarthrobacter sp. NS4]